MPEVQRLDASARTTDGEFAADSTAAASVACTCCFHELIVSRTCDSTHTVAVTTRGEWKNLLDGTKP